MHTGAPVEQLMVPGLHVVPHPIPDIDVPPPQRPDAWQVSPFVQALLSLQSIPIAATQVPVANEQGAQVPHAAPLFCQAPAVSQTCGCVPEHCLALGIQTPLQVPVLALQTFGQAAPLFCQTPAAEQTCGCKPLHCLALGVHEPEQAPPPQTYWQAAPVFCHTPAASQTCG
jgi:hypothetical protein